MIFNINDYVKVKLNSAGITILENLHNELNKLVKNLKPFKIPEVDSDGYTKFQLWELMEKFGPHVGLGKYNPFYYEIFIPDNEEKKNEKG